MSFKTLLSDSNKLIALDTKHKDEKKTLEINIGKEQIKRFKADIKELCDILTELDIYHNLQHWQDGSSEMGIMWSGGMWITITQEKNSDKFIWHTRSSYGSKDPEHTEKSIFECISKAMTAINNRYGKNTATPQFQKLYAI